MIAQEDIAGLTGTWEFAISPDDGSEGGVATFTFELDGEKISGTYKGMFGESKITGSIEGNKFQFKFDVSDLPNIIYEGTIEGETTKGTCDFGGYLTGTFRGKRKPEENK